MKRSVVLFVLFVVGPALAAGAAAAQGSSSEGMAATAAVPAGYKLLYTQDFQDPSSLNDFEFSDPSRWLHATMNGDGCLEYKGGGAYRPKVRSPRTIGLISDRTFGDFVLEVKILQTGREYGHRDACVYFGFTDRGKFYYAHIATRTDPHAHNIFIVNDKPRTKISTKTTQGVKWGENQWHTIRVERKISGGSIKVFYDDMTTPIMLATDTTFKHGYIGFGTFDDSGRVDRIRVWGPAVKTATSAFFKKKGTATDTK